MADGGPEPHPEPGGLDPLLLDTILRANASWAALGLIIVITLPVLAVLAGPTRWWSWSAAAITIVAVVVTVAASARRSARIERELAAMVGDSDA